MVNKAGIYTKPGVVVEKKEDGTVIIDTRKEVIDKYHRTHDVPNLFICDGSSMVTSGRGQPTMTIMALAFRAAEHIGNAARNNEI